MVAIQDFPDPDAISSALAYRQIAEPFGIEVSILYEGMISHPENLALVNLLGIDVTRYMDSVPLTGYDAAVYIDNQGTTTRLAPRLREAQIPTFAVIDHHDLQDVLEPLFSDVRPVGAAATIFAEYLSSGAFPPLDAENPQHVQLATALMHGLYSETGGLLHAGQSEYEAAGFLSHYLDPDLLERVLCVQKSHGTMDTIRAALERRTIRGGFCVTGVGFVRWSDRDAIPQAADFLLNEETVHTAIVYGLLRGEDNREIISGSLRTTNAAMGVDNFLKKALGKDIRGRAYGGGRSRAGGFEIDVGFLTSERDDVEVAREKWQLFDRQIRDKLFHAAGFEPEFSAAAAPPAASHKPR